MTILTIFKRLRVLYGREAQAVLACLVTFTNWALMGK